MNKKIAIPTEGGKLCAHFGHCESFYMATIQEGLIVEETMVTPPAHEPGLYPAWVGQQGVGTYYFLWTCTRRGISILLRT